MLGFLLMVVIAFITFPLSMASDNVKRGRRRSRYRGRSGRRRRR